VPPAEAGSFIKARLQRGAEAPLYPYDTKLETAVAPLTLDPLPHLHRKILKTKSCRKKIPAKYCIQGIYRQNIEPQRLTGC
jgi:hypothetical protein